MPPTLSPVESELASPFGVNRLALAPAVVMPSPAATPGSATEQLSDAEAWRREVVDAYERRGARKPSPLTNYCQRRIRERVARIVEPGARVLEIGCGEGDLLAALRPCVGVGVDLRERAVLEARRRHPGFRFTRMAGEEVDRLGDTFDYVVISQTLGEIHDLRALLRAVQWVCHSRTRVVIVHYSRVWQPALKLMEWLRINPPSPQQNWVPPDETIHLLKLNDFETVNRFGMTLAPLYVPFLSNMLNRLVGNLPGLHHLGLNYVIVARCVAPRLIERNEPRSVSIVIPARNEAGHIEPLLKRIPRLAPRQEIIFVEGGSSDGSWDVIRRAVAGYDGPFNVKAIRQTGRGRGDAVRAGFAAAVGEVLMILDADISVPPEELPAFYEALANGRGEFINGSRMVYLTDRRAMRFSNLLANKLFGWLFTYLLFQRFRDTLCGTKVLTRSDYERIAANRAYFGEFDPFGDFDLLFGAAKLNLKITDMPVHYKGCSFGETNRSRFRHGWMLLKMCLFAARKIRFV